MPAALKERLLVVDDALDTREVLQRNLGSQGYLVFTATNVAEAVQLLETVAVDLVITDLKMPGASGLDLVRHVRENLKNTEVMMITGYPTIEGAIAAVKIGAEEYLAKPFTQGELFTSVRRTLDKLQMKRSARGAGILAAPVFGLIGESEPMARLFAAIRTAGATDPILILGENGTGKELVARAIHYQSSRAAAPFITVRCGGVPQDLLENELFGCTRSQFSGAGKMHAGLLQAADGGTVFLDEVSALSIPAQDRLSRFLQDSEIRVAGSAEGKIVDVRIIASSAKDMPALVARGLFHQDLLARIHVAPMTVPPLRQRGDDLLLLIRHFVKISAQESGKAVEEVSPRALEILRNYPWPGNVRELEGVIQRAVASAEGRAIDAPDLPGFMRAGSARETELRRTLAEVETEYVQSVLASVGGNKSRAAEILGIDRKTLRKRIQDPA